MPPRALDERSDLQDWVAHLPGAEPPWNPSGLSHGAGRGDDFWDSETNAINLRVEEAVF